MSITNRKPIFMGAVDPVVIPLAATLNLQRDGGSTITDVLTGASNCGTFIESLKVTAQSVTTTGLVNFFFKESGGSTYKFFGDVTVTAATPSATVSPFQGYLAGEIMPFYLAPGDKIGCAPTKAEPFNVIAKCGPLENIDSGAVAQ